MQTLSLLAMMVTIVSAGVAVGATIRYLLPGSGIEHFLIECALWLTAVAVLASPLIIMTLRQKILEAISR